MLEGERRELEREMEQHLKWNIDKKRRLNSLSIVGCLPLEILIEIFLLASASPSLASAHPAHPPTRSYKWIRITHVCHYWREAALLSSRLWANISVRCSLECLEEMLARSKQAPLSAIADFSRPVGTQLVLDQLQRITGLDLSTRPRVSQQQPTVPEHAPHLELLVLRFHDYFADIGSKTPFDQCDMPRLTQLELYDNELVWGCGIFKPTLTSLSVTCNHRRLRSSLPELLDVLDTMPQLRSLQLRHALPPITPELPSVTRQVSLTQLQSLSLTGTTRQCVWVMQHLSYPVTTTMCLEGEETTSIDVQHLSETISKKLQAAATNGEQVLPITTASIKNESEQWYAQFKAWTAPRSQATCTADVSVLPVLPLLNIVFCEDSNFILFDLFHSGLPLTEVETLHIAPTRFVCPNKARWRRVYDSMPNLRELSVGSIAQDTIADTLMLRVPKADTPSDKPSKRRRMQPILPNLKKLVLQHVFFRPSYLVMSHDNRPTKYRKMLAARQRSRRMIHELVLDRCVNMCAEDVDKLRPLVGRVQWDPSLVRREVPDSDDESDFDDDSDDEYFP